MKKPTIKKTIWIKTSALAVQAIPPVVVLCCNFPVFIQRTGATISAAGILVAIILALIFRDATKKIFQTPSAFKTCIIVFLISLIAVNLGEQMLAISATALISGACGIPLNMWYNKLTQPPTNDAMLEGLKNLLKKEDSPDDESI